MGWFLLSGKKPLQVKYFVNLKKACLIQHPNKPRLWVTGTCANTRSFFPTVSLSGSSRASDTRWSREPVTGHNSFLVGLSNKLWPSQFPTACFGESPDWLLPGIEPAPLFWMLSCPTEAERSQLDDVESLEVLFSNRYFSFALASSQHCLSTVSMSSFKK